MTSESVLTSIDEVVESGRTVISGDSSIVMDMVEEAMQKGTTIDAVVESGRTIISGDSAIVMGLLQEAVQKGTILTFYVPRSQFDPIMRQIWTPERIKEAKMESVSKEETDRIERELEVPCEGEILVTRLECPCGDEYGAFEFMQQGIRTHGKDWMNGVIGLKKAAIIRANPSNNPICPKCKQALATAFCYSWCGYYSCC